MPQRRFRGMGSGARMFARCRATGSAIVMRAVVMSQVMGMVKLLPPLSAPMSSRGAGVSWESSLPCDTW